MRRGKALGHVPPGGLPLFGRRLLTSLGPSERSDFADSTAPGMASHAGCLHRLGRQKEAISLIQQHLEWRASGTRSIYSLKEARKRLRQIAGSSLGDVIERETKEAGKK